ncbi:hypothetical protein ACJ41O_007012 [Fusarium nematophilum]
MSPKSYSGNSSVYSDDRISGFSTTSSQWTTTYAKIPKKQPMSIRFLSWVAGAPPGATAVKKRTRDIPDDRSNRSGYSTRSYFSEPDTQLYWVAPSSSHYYYGGSGGSSSSGRSSHSGRSGRSRKHGGSRGKHFDGALPRPAMPPPPGPMGDHFPPPPPPPGHMGGGFGGFPPPPPPMGAVPHMPPPPPPMNPPMQEAAPFIDVTGQNQPGNPFHGGPMGGGYSSASSDSYYSSDEE